METNETTLFAAIQDRIISDKGAQAIAEVWTLLPILCELFTHGKEAFGIEALYKYFTSLESSNELINKVCEDSNMVTQIFEAQKKNIDRWELQWNLDWILDNGLYHKRLGSSFTELGYLKLDTATLIKHYCKDVVFSLYRNKMQTEHILVKESDSVLIKYGIQEIETKLKWNKFSAKETARALSQSFLVRISENEYEFLEKNTTSDFLRFRDRVITFAYIDNKPSLVGITDEFASKYLAEGVK